jgi:hypothetical protein
MLARTQVMRDQPANVPNEPGLARHFGPIGARQSQAQKRQQQLGNCAHHAVFLGGSIVLARFILPLCGAKLGDHRKGLPLRQRS